MCQKNDFILIMNQKMKHLTKEKRKEVVNRIVNKFESDGILSPLSITNDIDFDCSEDFNPDNGDFLAFTNIGKVEFKNLSISEQNIRIKQTQLKIEVDPIIATTTTTAITDTNYGRNHLHESVLLQDKEAVVLYLKQGYNPKSTDNNGNTPYDLAILRDDKDMIGFLKSVKADC